MIIEFTCPKCAKFTQKEFTIFDGLGVRFGWKAKSRSSTFRERCPACQTLISIIFRCDLRVLEEKDTPCA